MSKQFLFSLLLFIIAPAYAIQFPYELPGALIDETASNLQGPFDDWKIWCHPVIMSNEPDDNQDEVEPGFISYPMTCKEDQRKFELWVNCKDKQIWGRMGWYSYEHGWWADTFRPVEDKFTTLDSLYYNAGRTGGYSLFYVNYLAYVSHAVFQPIYQAICLSK